MADGLHAMAQPLTVLRGALGAWKLHGSQAMEKDHYLEMATRQVGRMSDLFWGLQAVLDTAEGKSNREKFDIEELTRSVLEDMGSDLRECGARIDLTVLDSQIQVFGDAENTERAIRAALRVASSVSSGKGELRLSACSCTVRVELIAEAAANKGQPLSFADRLNLSLVESNIRGQGGRYKCVEDPLSILLELPRYGNKVKEGAVETDRAQEEACS
jgi:hypothetical protein